MIKGWVSLFSLQQPNLYWDANHRNSSSSCCPNSALEWRKILNPKWRKIHLVQKCGRRLYHKSPFNPHLLLLLLLRPIFEWSELRAKLFLPDIFHFLHPLFCCSSRTIFYFPQSSAKPICEPTAHVQTSFSLIKSCRKLVCSSPPKKK